MEKKLLFVDKHVRNGCPSIQCSLISLYGKIAIVWKEPFGTAKKFLVRCSRWPTLLVRSHKSSLCGMICARLGHWSGWFFVYYTLRVNAAWVWTPLYLKKAANVFNVNFGKNDLSSIVIFTVEATQNKCHDFLNR